MASLTKEQTQVKSFIVGIGKHFPGATPLAFGSATYTPAALTQLFQSFVDGAAGVVAAQAQYKAKLEAQRALTVTVRTVILAFRSFVIATFSHSPDVLADFGIAPRKAPTPTPAATKALAVEKRLATREARHTMGKKEKLAIKGSVPEPVTPPAPPSPPIAPPPTPPAAK